MPKKADKKNWRNKWRGRGPLLGALMDEYPGTLLICLSLPHYPIPLRNATPTEVARRAPVARERWIGGWEAPVLARRLLVDIMRTQLVKVSGGTVTAESVSDVSKGLERRRGRGIMDSKGHGTGAMLTYPNNTKLA